MVMGRYEERSNHFDTKRLLAVLILGCTWSDLGNHALQRHVLFLKASHIVLQIGHGLARGKRLLSCLSILIEFIY